MGIQIALRVGAGAFGDGCGQVGLGNRARAQHLPLQRRLGRDAQLQKVPYMLVVGDKEAAADAVSVRLRTNENLGSVPLDEFIQNAQRLAAARSQELWPDKQPA